MALIETNQSTDLANIEKDLLKYTQETLRTEQHMRSGRKFVSLNNSMMSIDGEQFKNNQLHAIIIDSVIEQKFYPNVYKANAGTTPECYAFGRVESELKPHEAVDKPIAKTCLECPNYQWGSREGGGKLCQSRRRLAIMYAGEFEKKQDGSQIFQGIDENTIISSEIVYLCIPVTSIVNYTKYVKKVAEITKRPPFAIYTLITLSTDCAAPFELRFNLIDTIPVEHIPLLIDLHEKEKTNIMFPYHSKQDEDEHTEEDKQQKSSVVQDYSKVSTAASYQHKF